MNFLNKYYPLVLSFIAMLYSVILWFSGDKDAGLYVGLLPITILAFTLVFAQIQNQHKGKK
ncbi:MAG TPA: hypothetical protein DCZ44_00815 [Flavobacteriaceae bacterium]|nr:hypothetical protein [Flavobacteriaceae bacterium]